MNNLDTVIDFGSKNLRLGVFDQSSELIYSSKISDIIDRYPSLEILALCFLILIGFTLILEAAHIEIPKGYIYFALFFTLGVELINIKFRRVSLKRVKLKK